MLVFVALVWLRVVFIAMTYGAALARYRDATPSARHPSTAGLDPAATEPEDDRLVKLEGRVHLEGQACQGRAQAIVQVAPQPAALFLTCVHQALARQLQIFL